MGNDFFGQGRFIDGKQRLIPDHFHWHVRKLEVVNDILAVRLLGVEPQMGDASVRIASTLEEAKVVSEQLVRDHVGGKDYSLLEKRVQRGMAMPSKGNEEFIVHSKVRLDFDGFHAIEQQVIVKVPGIEKLSQARIIPHILATVFYRVSTRPEFKNDTILAKL